MTTNDPFGYTESLSQLDDEKLIERFNKEVGNTGWGTARSHYLEALRKELLKRNFYLEDVITDEGLALSKKVKLENNLIALVD